jgi:hypothetical protein
MVQYLKNSAMFELVHKRNDLHATDKVEPPFGRHSTASTPFCKSLVSTAGSLDSSHSVHICPQVGALSSIMDEWVTQH